MKSPLRASGNYFRINMMLTEPISVETDLVRHASEANLVISVPKRWVKRAIDRNTIKRLGRVWWDSYVQSQLYDHLSGQEAGLGLSSATICLPRMAFVQITPKMLNACRSKKAGEWAYLAWKQELAMELQGLGVKIQSRYSRIPAHQPVAETAP